jgi:hypothetical protein
MASKIIPTKQAAKAARLSFAGPQSGNGSIFPDKRGLRGSTPDSTAPVSSEGPALWQLGSPFVPSVDAGLDLSSVPAPSRDHMPHLSSLWGSGIWGPPSPSLTSRVPPGLGLYEDNESPANPTHGQLEADPSVLGQLRDVTTVVAPSSSFSTTNSSFGSRHQVVVPEGDEYAVDEPNGLNELQGLASKGNPARRFSEYNATRDGRFASDLPDNRRLDSIGKGQWQSPLGFRL